GRFLPSDDHPVKHLKRVLGELKQRLHVVAREAPDLARILGRMVELEAADRYPHLRAIGRELRERPVPPPEATTPGAGVPGPAKLAPAPEQPVPAPPAGAAPTDPPSTTALVGAATTKV